MITVGASNTLGSDSRLDDVMATYSSRGPTRSFWIDASGTKHYDNLVKPDLVAPGNKIIDAQSPNNLLVIENPMLDANVSGNWTREQMYLSGTSMATPFVSGAAALMLQANPKLTPNMVKMLMMYTAQALQNFNHFEQGAGQVNVDRAVRLAKLVRQDLTASTAVGSPLLTTTTVPVAQSTIAGNTVSWSQGIVMDHSYAKGINLITKYQKVYGLGYTLADGTVETNGVLMTDGVLMGDGITMSDNILTVTGITMGDGLPFLACGVLMGDGVLMADVSAAANNAMIYGDSTAVMNPTADVTPDDPSSLSARAASTTQINLTWLDNSTNETGFAIERCAGSTCTNFVEVATIGANASSFSNTGLVKGTAYRYRVRAFNGSSYSFYTATVSATTPSR